MFVAIMKYGCIPFKFLLSHRYAAIRLLLTTPSRHSRDDGPAAAPASHNVAFVAEAVRDQSQQYYPEPGDVRILQRHERQGEHHVPHGDHDRRLQIARGLMVVTGYVAKVVCMEAPGQGCVQFFWHEEAKYFGREYRRSQSRCIDEFHTGKHV